MGVIKRQGLKNVFITYFGILVGAVSTILIQPSLLSTDELGYTRSLYSFSFLLSIAIPVGLPNIIVKFFPYFKEKLNSYKRFFGFAMVYFALAGCLVLLLFLLFRPAILSIYKTDSQLFVANFFFVIPFSLILSFNAILTAYCQAAYKSTVPSFMNDIVARVLLVLITVLYYYRLISFDAYIYMYTGIYLLVCAVLLFYLMHFRLISLKIDTGALKQLGLKKIVLFGLMLCVTSFASFGLKSLDVIFLGIYSLKSVAIYTTAVFIAAFIEVPLNALERISHTRISESFSKQHFAEVEKIYSESVKYLLIIGGLLFLGINTCTRYVYGFLPYEYIDSLHIVFIISLSSLINVATGINSAILFYSSYYRQASLMLFLILAFTIALDLLLIPRYGMTGAAIATASASAIFNISKMLFIYKKFGFQPYNGRSAMVCGVIAVGLLIIYLLPHFSDNKIVNIIVNGTVISAYYVGCVYYLRLAPEIFSAIKGRLLKS